MILYIDNYDSDMNSIYKLLTEEYADICIIRSDEKAAEELLWMNPEAVIIGSGSGTVNDTGCCTEAVRLFSGNIPVLGIGLGAHAVCASFGGSAAFIKVPDGKPYNTGFDTSCPVFEGMEQIICCNEELTASVAPENLPECLCITARDEYGRGLAFEHREYPVYGLCLAPSSLGEDNCRTFLSNFIGLINE